MLREDFTSSHWYKVRTGRGLGNHHNAIFHQIVWLHCHDGISNFWWWLTSLSLSFLPSVFLALIGIRLHSPSASQVQICSRPTPWHPISITFPLDLLTRTSLEKVMMQCASWNFVTLFLGHTRISNFFHQWYYPKGWGLFQCVCGMLSSFHPQSNTKFDGVPLFNHFGFYALAMHKRVH